MTDDPFWEEHDFESEPSFLPFADGSEAKWMPQWGIWAIVGPEGSMAAYMVALFNHIEAHGGKKSYRDAAERRRESR